MDDDLSFSGRFVTSRSFLAETRDGCGAVVWGMPKPLLTKELGVTDICPTEYYFQGYIFRKNPVTGKLDTISCLWDITGDTNTAARAEDDIVSPKGEDLVDTWIQLRDMQIEDYVSPWPSKEFDEEADDDDKE